MDTTTSNMPRAVSDCMLNLRVISRIPTNHKLNVNSKTYSNANSNIDALWRRVYDETGDKTIDFINGTIDDTIKASRENSGWTELLADSVCSISNALINLRQIYERDNKELIVGKIDLIRNRIDKDRFLRTCKEVKILTSDVSVSHSNPEPSIILQQSPVNTKPLPIPGSVIRTGPSGITASLTPDPRCHSCSHTPSPAPI